MREVRSSLPDLTIRQLEYLVAVADQATWAAAAQHVGVSPSALSQGLAELERRLGTALFEPVGRRRVLRQSSTPVLDHARRVLALTADLVDWSSRVRDGRVGRVRVGMIDVAAVVHFTDVVAAFRAEHPDVALTLSVAPSTELLDRLRDGELDLVVCVEPPERPEGLHISELVREPLFVIAPPGTRIGAPANWGPWVMFPSGSHTRRLILDALARLGAPVTIAAESHQPAVLHQMVRLGLGWTVLPTTAPAPPSSSSSSAIIGPAVVERIIVLARRAGSIHDPAADELAQRLSRSAADGCSPARSGARKRNRN